MNDLFIENITNNGDGTTKRESCIELEFLSEFGAGVSEEDEIMKKLIFTDEEGRDFSEI
jgi:hypothetical protein